MNITKRLAIKYAKKLLPHFNLENYPAIFKDADKPGFEKELIFDLKQKSSTYTREHDSQTIRFLFSKELSLYQDLDTGLELDITSDLNHYLKTIQILNRLNEKRKQNLEI